MQATARKMHLNTKADFIINGPQSSVHFARSRLYFPGLVGHYALVHHSLLTSLCSVSPLSFFAALTLSCARFARSERVLFMLIYRSRRDQ